MGYYHMEWQEHGVRMEELPLNGEEASRALAGLDAFLKRTWQFTHIGDFNNTQIGWDGAQWILFDFTSASIRFKVFDDTHVWEDPSASPVSEVTTYIRDRRCQALLSAGTK
jgi:hypothetical protein